MRSLNTSLPSASRRKRAKQRDVHQSFRSAALTVTNLYKAALADIDNARSEGYQDALEDLIDFLDKENMGVSDGEGWRVRQWATERFEAAQRGQNTSDSDEDAAEERRARSSSPAMERVGSPEMSRADPPQSAPTPRSDSAPPAQPEVRTMAVDPEPAHNIFTFRASTTLPIHTSNEPVVSEATPVSRRPEFSSPRRPSNRPSTRIRPSQQALLNLGNGAGHKRKHALNEFFNVDSSFSDRRDGNGGGKRGRMA